MSETKILDKPSISVVNWQLAYDSEFKNISHELINDIIHIREWEVDPLDYGTTYYVHVSYSDEYNRQTTWSNTVKFTTIKAYVPPPTITYPTNGLQDVDPTNPVNITTTDYDNTHTATSRTTHKSTTWRICKVDVNGEVLILDEDNTESLTNFILNNLEWGEHNNPNVGKYSIQVKYKSSRDIESDWSEPAIFTTWIRYIPVPNVTSPANNLEDVDPHKVKVTLTPYDKSDISTSNTNHTSTSWLIATDSNFNNIIVNSVKDTEHLESYPPLDLEMTKTYYIKVRYHNNRGVDSDWSPVSNFSTWINFIPVPSVEYPANNLEDVEPYDLSIRLSPYDKSHKATKNTTHTSTDWIISEDENFTDILVNSIKDTANLTSYPPLDLEMSKTYYIKVKYRNNRDIESEWSNVSKFSTWINFIPVPSVVSPANNLKDVDPHEVRITLSHYDKSHKATKNTNHTSTSWLIASDPDFNNIVIRQNKDTEHLEYYILNDLSMTATYYIKVKYHNDRNIESEWSPVSKFYTWINYIPVPSVVYPANNSTNIPTGNTNITLSPYNKNHEATSNTTHTSTSWLIASDSSFNNIIVNSIKDTSHLTSYPITVSFNKSYYIKVQYHNNRNISSEWSSVYTFKGPVASVSTPTVSIADNLTYVDIIGSRYSNVGGGKHIASEWMLSKNDPNFNESNIVYHTTTNYDSSKDEAHNLLWLEQGHYEGLERSTTYYAKCRYKDSIAGWSEWSNVASHRTSSYFVGKGKRLFYRHESNMGTVMIWRDKSNNERKTIVLDAAYRRGGLNWCGSYGKAEVNTPLHPNRNNSLYYMPSEDIKNAFMNSVEYIGFPDITDAQINSAVGYWENQTSRACTNEMVAVGLTSINSASGYCRSIKISGKGCDLPNMCTLIHMHASMFDLELLDPTAPSCPNTALTRKNTRQSMNWYWGSGNKYVWSSESYDTVGNACGLANNGFGWFPWKDSSDGGYMTIPVLDL